MGKALKGGRNFGVDQQAKGKRMKRCVCPRLFGARKGGREGVKGGSPWVAKVGGEKKVGERVPRPQRKKGIRNWEGKTA